ncbi:MAG: DEAD/DEAH box helicase, partial [Bacteroidota bacterium]
AADKVQSDSPWQRLAERWKQFEALDEAPLPDGFKGELRPYQRHGLAFLLFLREHGFHGILADDMGLGKTVQAIALLATPTDEPPLPSLVIAPTSVVYNWEQELSRFAPHLRVLSLHGPSRKEHFDRLGDYDVILTSFALMRRDSAYLEKQEYSHLILDEAQAIKNPASQTSKLVRRLQARHRFSLTGTPLENHLGELWAQFAFLMPGLFGSERQFQERYLTPINAGQEDRLKELRARSNPFILRRLKKEVAKDLPPRTEIVAYCELDPAQREIYDRVLADVRAKVMKTVESQGMERSHITILDGLLRLRQICCHPRLMSVEEPDISSKLDLFMELVEGLLAEGHRALVFSQFVKMLELVSKKLNEKGIPYEYLDGRTRDRQARVDRFNNSKTPLFLISHTAGGTGLNLTGADYVIHFDPWWNPAVEAQATDRAHRIGQSKQVFSYKLIARDSIEEKVLKLQERKKALISDIILSEEGMAKQLSRDDLDFLFK